MLLMGTLLLGLGGCVYLRLYAVYRQMQDFDAQITVPAGARLSLQFRTPKLKRDDPEALIGAPPSQVTAHDGGERLTWCFRRVLADGDVVPDDGKELTFDIEVRDGRVTAVTFPAQVDRVLDRATAVAMLKSLGHGRVDTTARAVEADFRPDAVLDAATLARTARISLEAVLGAPSRTAITDGRQWAFYDYRLDGVAAAPPAVASIGFDYGVENLRAQAVRVTINKLWLSLRLAAPVAPAASAPAVISDSTD